MHLRSTSSRCRMKNTWKMNFRKLMRPDTSTSEAMASTKVSARWRCVSSAFSIRRLRETLPSLRCHPIFSKCCAKVSSLICRGMRTWTWRKLRSSGCLIMEKKQSARSKSRASLSATPATRYISLSSFAPTSRIQRPTGFSPPKALRANAADSTTSSGASSPVRLCTGLFP